LKHLKRRDLALLPQWLDTGLMLQLPTAQFSAGFPNRSHL
jgi:hypothetical protein